MDEKVSEIIEEDKNIEADKSFKRVEVNETNKNTKPKKEKSWKKFVVLLILILIITILSTVFALLNLKSDKIVSGISISDIDVSNMTREEAKKKIDDVYKSKLTEDIVLGFNKYETTINPSQVSASFDVEKAVDEAYNVGRNSNIFVNNYNIISTRISKKEIDLPLLFDETLLENKTNDISSKLPDAIIQNSYYIEDEELIIVKGTAGNAIKSEEFKESLKKVIKDISKKNVIELPVENVNPDPIDLEKIRSEIYREPENAYVQKEPFEVHPNINGVDFGISLDEAKEIIKEDKKEYEIPLKITVADITLTDLGEEAFPNRLSTFTTYYNSDNYNRSVNVELSAQKINGTVILPGEIFSYNQVVGERTISKGYREAAAYAGGKIVQSVGGGICQTSSTLYNAALLANLEITDRSNHLFETSYVEPSRDATVSWGTLDFQFKNTRKYPIEVITSVGGGEITVSIYGVREDVEYDVIIDSRVTSYIPFSVQYKEDKTLEEGQEIIEQSGFNGCNSEAYRILKYKGEVVSEELLSRDTYDPMERIVIKGTKKKEVEKEVVPVNKGTTEKNKTEDKTENKTETNINKNTQTNKQTKNSAE